MHVVRTPILPFARIAKVSKIWLIGFLYEGKYLCGTKKNKEEMRADQARRQT
jgi:hypothetical protein